MTTEPQAATQETLRTVAYSSDKVFQNNLPLALFMCCVGLFVLTFDDGNKWRHTVGAWIVIAAGLIWLGYVFYRSRQPSRPTLTLTPAHVAFRIPMLKEIHIPWREIGGLESMTVRAFYPSLVLPRFFVFRDVTAIRVSRAFYDRHIHVASAVMRGPGWHNTFFVDQESAKIALHHEALGVPAEDVRHAVETRWRAFGPPDAVAAAPPLPRLPGQPAHASGTVETPARGVSLAGAGRALLIVMLLAGIAVLLANVAGYWRTESQTKAEEWRAQLRQWEEQDKRDAEERRRREKEWEDFWRKNPL